MKTRIKKVIIDGMSTIIKMIVIPVIGILTIIGILAAIVIPNFINYKNKSYCTATVSDVEAISRALEDYFANNNANVTASTQYNLAAPPSNRPYIFVGKTGGDKDGYNANTVLLSGSTTIPGNAAQFVPTATGIGGAAAGAFKSGNDYVVYACEGAGMCPKKITSSDIHWVNDPVTKTPCTNSYCCYFKTM